MRSTATSVDDYLAEAPQSRRAALDALRDRCRRRLDGFDEAMVYGMPSYSRDGMVEIAFASQKHHISFYVLRGDVLDDHRHEFVGADLGKGCVRFRRPDQIDLDLVERILRETAASHGPIC